MPPRPGDVLSGDFWPEPVRVLTVQEIGTRTKIEAVGVNTRQFYENIFSPQDLSNVQVRSEAYRDFGVNGEAFFLAMEEATPIVATEDTPFVFGKANVIRYRGRKEQFIDALKHC